MNGEVSVPETLLALDVALTPAFVASDVRARERTTFIVVDIIRATTTLSVLFERGCRRVLIAAGIAEARAFRDAGGRAMLLAGEVGGVAPAGFDFGNSPAELGSAAVAGRDVIFATTNGTRALRACTGGRAIYAGALRNASAVCAAALESALSETAEHDGAAMLDQPGGTSGGASEATLGGRAPDIVIVCSGRGDRPAYDDTICAGYLTGELMRLARERGARLQPHEGTRIALAAAEGVMRHGELRAALALSDAARAIERVGLGGDLDWCAALDAAQVVPVETGTSPEGLLLIEPLASM